jgi:hypothetical protein
VCRVWRGVSAVPTGCDQTYCGKEECRRTRRRRWQRAKRQKDADYRDNQARAQRAWSAENSAYWQACRSEHPEYVRADRAGARRRKTGKGAARGGASEFVKMDSIGPFSSLHQGLTFWCSRGRKSSQRWTR